MESCFSTPMWVAAAAAAAMIPFCLWAAFADVRERRIPNKACLAIALLALPYGLADPAWCGLAGLGSKLLWLLLLAGSLYCAFAWRLIGGGDVKFILALSLWADAVDLPWMLLAIALAGGGLAGLFLIWRRLVREKGAPTLPYGVAILIGATSVLGPAFGGLLARL